MGDGRILVQATVTAVNDDNFLYPCCIQCYSKLLEDVQNNRWHCMKCGESYIDKELEWRYRLRLTIADTNEYRQVAVFGRTVQPFFGASANTFYRFLSHLQKTECEMADMVLKQAVDLVFIGQTFMFGFASASRHRAPIMVSCLSHATETKGSNSDLIAVQMISPDPSQMTTVSQQISILFKEMVSNSFHQASLEEKAVDTSAGSNLTKRRSSCQIAQQLFNSVLELSENNSVNSLVSVLFSCENSLANNTTGSPATLSADSLCGRLDLIARREDAHTTPCKEVSVHKVHSSETTFKEATTRSFGLEEHDFDETMNDSSLLLGDKDSYLQNLGEKVLSCEPHTNSCNSHEDQCATTLSVSENLLINRDEEHVIAVETDDLSDVIWEDMPYSEDLDEFLSKANCKRKSETPLTDGYKQCQYSMKKNISPVGLIEKCRTSDLEVSGITKVAAQSVDAGLSCFKELDEDEGFDNMGYTSQPCLDFSFKLKEPHDMDESCDKYSHRVTLNEMAVFSDVTETTICKDYENQAVTSSCHQNKLTDPCGVRGLRNRAQSHKGVSCEDVLSSNVPKLPSNKDIHSLSEKCQGPHSSRNDVVVNIPSEPQPDLEAYFANTFSSDDDCSEIFSCPCDGSGDKVGNLLNSSSQTREEALSVARDPSYSVDVEINTVGQDHFPKSETFPHDSGDHCSEILPCPFDGSGDRVQKYSDSPSETNEEDLSISHDQHPSVDVEMINAVDQEHFPKGKTLKTGHDVSMIPFDESSDKISCDLESVSQSSQAGSNRSPTCTNEGITQSENQKEMSVPVHLFHSVGSVCSLNGSMELFDASVDLFEDVDEDDQEKLWATGNGTSGISHLSAVCDSIDDSIKLSLSSKNIPDEALESQKKKVKFAKRLSHISTIQLIDIRMKLNFGIPVDSQSTPVKPCMKNYKSETLSQRTYVRPSVTTKLHWNSSQSDTESPTQTKRCVTDDHGGSTAEFPMSQDLFAGSQPLDCTGSPSQPACLSDYVANDTVDCFSDAKDKASTSDKLQDSDAHSVLGTSVAEVPTDSPLTNKSCYLSYNRFTSDIPAGCSLSDKSSYLSYNHFNSGIQPKGSFPETKLHVKRSNSTEHAESEHDVGETKCKDMYPFVTDEAFNSDLTPSGASPELFSQADHTILGSQISSTPNGDPGGTLLQMTLTPDLFTP